MRESSTEYGAVSTANAVAQLTPSPIELHPENLTPGYPGPHKVQLHQLDVALESIIDPIKLGQSLLKLVKAGELPAIKYVYDRLAGLPVQRHEAKLMQQVDDTAEQLAKAYGMTVEEVRAAARRIAQGT